MGDFQAILDLRFDADGDDVSIRQYLYGLLVKLWSEKEEFNSKLPFGRICWGFTLYAALVKHEVIDGKFDDDGYLDDCDTALGDLIVKGCIAAMCGIVI